MNPQNVSRLFGAVLSAAFVVALSPTTLSAQTAGTYVSSGAAKFQQGDDDGAIADYTKALELNSSILGAYLGRGMAENREGNFDGAIKDFGAAIKLKPASAEAYLSRGLASFLQGNMDAANNDLNKAVELKADSQLAYFYRALTRQCQTDYQGANADYTKAMALKPTGDATANYVSLYAALNNLRMGNPLDARIKVATDWSNAWTKALAAFMSNQMNEADLLKLAATGFGDNAASQTSEALYLAGSLKVVAGDKAGAKAEFQKCFDGSDPATVVHRLARAELDHS